MPANIRPDPTFDGAINELCEQTEDEAFGHAERHAMRRIGVMTRNLGR